MKHTNNFMVQPFHFWALSSFVKTIECFLWICSGPHHLHRVLPNSLLFVYMTFPLDRIILSTSLTFFFSLSFLTLTLFYIFVVYKPRVYAIQYRMSLFIVVIDQCFDLHLKSCSIMRVIRKKDKREVV